LFWLGVALLVGEGIMLFLVAVAVNCEAWVDAALIEDDGAGEEVIAPTCGVTETEFTWLVDNPGFPASAV